MSSSRKGLRCLRKRYRACARSRTTSRRNPLRLALPLSEGIPTPSQLRRHSKERDTKDVMTTATPTKVATVQNYVNGQWITSVSSDQQDVINPATNETLARVPLSTKSDVGRAVDAAAAAFPAWHETPAEE